MRISVNRKLNVAYVHFQDQPAPLETKRLSGDLFTDVVDCQGSFYRLCNDLKIPWQVAPSEAEEPP